MGPGHLMLRRSLLTFDSSGLAKILSVDFTLLPGPLRKSLAMSYVFGHIAQTIPNVTTVLDSLIFRTLVN